MASSAVIIRESHDCQCDDLWLTNAATASGGNMEADLKPAGQATANVKVCFTFAFIFMAK
jgi:hypothetical protein